MKKSAEMKGLPIISIADGNEIGSVKSLVINPEKGSVDFLTIEHEDWQVSVKAIPFKKVIGIGEFAVTVDNENAVIDLNEIPIANSLVNKKIKINDTRVMTRKGQLVGDVVEFMVDDDTGSILGMQIKTNSQEALLEAQYVLTYGKDIIIVQEEATNHFKSSLDEKKDDVVEELLEDVSPTQGIEQIQNKQVNLLVGKRVTKDIYDPTGSVIIAADTELEEAHILAAKAAGPSVFVELSMNVEA
ncbi:PRC-barrel domain-containing protein [Bacillus sp. 2205SS5-2]|uniref:PRC-barrel domain-containing protein n=1 Tax=Bacillus sp. 2205SS5-2 TaxID=3109031 RepID=UPI003004C2A3